MPELKLLDSYLGKEIAKKLDLECLRDKSVLKELLKTVKQYSVGMEMDDSDALKARKDDVISPQETFQYYRSHERIQYIQLMLQYLFFFLTNLPLEAEIKDKPVNPFDQFKEFVHYNTKLLKEDDVIEAVVNEYKRQGVLNERNQWYYVGQIDRCHKKIMNTIADALRATIKDYRKLFMGLQELCSFWFSVRNHDLKYIRKSDIYIYKLTWVLLQIHKDS